MDCRACIELKENAPDFVVNGVTDDICTSLKNNTGLNPSDGNDNCTDLDDAVECLVGGMVDEVEKYDACTWKDFARAAMANLTEVLKAIVCSICGTWSQIININQKLTAASYMGILTLERTSQIKGDGSTEQVLAFNKNTREGNVPSSVLQVASDYKGIVVRNTLNVPILVDTTFNSSIDTDQRVASCYILVRRGSDAIGQTPFITPDTYDQQVMGKPFILQPNQTATMKYAFRVGVANNWFQSEFGYMSGGSGEPKCCLEPTVTSGDARTQGSYFSVKVTSIVDQ